MKLYNTLFFLLCIAHMPLSAQNALWREKIPDAWLYYEELQPINTEIALVKQDNKWGIINLNNEVLAPPVYDLLQINDQLPGYIQILNGNASSYSTISGVLNLQGKEIVPPIFRMVRLLDNGNLRACNRQMECHDFTPDGKDVTGPLLQKYKSNGWEKNGLLAASEDGVFFGLIDEKSRWVVPQDHLDLYPVTGNWWVNQNWTPHQLIHPNHLDNPRLKNLYVVPLKDGSFWAKEGSHWNKYDAKGQFISELTDFVPLYATSVPGYRLIQKGYGYGLMDDNGKVLIEPIHQWFNNPLKYNTFQIANQDGLVGAWKDGKWVIPQEYEYISFSNNRFFAAKGRETKVFDLQFKLLETIPQRLSHLQNEPDFYFDESILANEFNQREMTAIPENRQIWSPQTGMLPIPDDVLFMVNEYRHALIVRTEDGNMSLINTKGEVPLSGYEEIQAHSPLKSGHGGWLIKKENRWGFVDHTFKNRIEPQYEELIPLKYGYFLARKGSSWGVLRQGEWVIPAEYDHYQKETVFLALRKNGKWTLFNAHLQRLTALEPETAKNSSSGIEITLDGQKQYLTEQGQLINPEIGIPEPFYRNPQFALNRDGKKALGDTNGQPLTEYKFSAIRMLVDHFEGWFQGTLMDGGMVIMDTLGKELLQVEEFKNIPPHLFCAKQGGKWHLLNRQLKQIGTAEAISPFTWNAPTAQFVAQTGPTTWGVFSAKGEVVRTFEADKVDMRNLPHRSHFKIDNKGQSYLISLYDVNQLPLFYDTQDTYSYVTTVSRNNLFGLNSPDGKELLPCVYTQLNWNPTHFELYKGDSLTVTDIFGNIVVPPCKKQLEKLTDETSSPFGKTFKLTASNANEIWDLRTGKRFPVNSTQLITCANRQVLLCSNQNYEYSLYNDQLQSMLPAPVQQIIQLSDSLLAIREVINGGKTRIFDPLTGKYTGLAFDNVMQRTNSIWRGFSGGITSVYCNRQLLFSKKTTNLDLVSFRNRRVFMYHDAQGWHLVNFKGEPITPVVYDDLMPNNDYQLPMLKAGKKGLLSMGGKELIAPQYDEIVAGSSSFFQVKKGNLWGIIDRQGVVRLPIAQTQIKTTPDGFIAVKNGKYSYYNDRCELLFPGEWEYADQFEDGLAAVRQNGKWGYLNRSGAVAIPYQFDYAHRFRANFHNATVIINDQFFDIDYNGKVSAKPTNGIPPYGEFFTPLDLLPDKDRYESYINIGGGWEIYTEKATRKYGLMNYAGTVFLKPEYDSIEYVYSEPGVWLKIVKNGKTQKVGPDGRINQD